MEEIKKILKFYENNGFYGVKLWSDCSDKRASGGKAALEKNWQKKEISSVDTFLQWLNVGNNLGIRADDLTIIDLDPGPTEDLKKWKNKWVHQLINYTLVMKTARGVQLWFQYDPNIRSTQNHKYKVDIRSGSGYVCVPPSVTEGFERQFLNFGTEINKIPEDFKKDLQEKGIIKTKNNYQKEKRIKLPEININQLDGGMGRHNSILEWGGYLRKFLNGYQLRKILFFLNGKFFDPPLEAKDIYKLVDYLIQYKMEDNNEFKQRILDYLEKVNEQTLFNIKKAIQDDSELIDLCLAELVKEKKINKKRNIYTIRKELEGRVGYTDLDKPIDFVLPYLGQWGHIRRGDLIIIGSWRGWGKCLGKDTPVLMYDGSVQKVQNVKNGDQIMGNDSTSRKVSGVVKGYGDLYKVTPIKGDSYIINSEHILSLKETGSNKVININVMDYLKLSKSKQSKLKTYRVDINFPAKPVSIDPYFLGIWLSDGEQSRPRICNEDSEVIKFLYQYAKVLDLQISKINNMYDITTGKQGGQPSRNILLENLKMYNVLYNKHIPQSYLTNCKSIRKSLLAGILDGDGYKAGNGCYEVVTYSDQYSKDILYLARSTGYAAYSSIKKVKLPNKKEIGIYYRIKISGIGDELPIKIKRKQSLKRKLNKSVLKSGIKVEYIGKDYYYGFCLNKNKLFVLGDFTVTHNTHIGCNINKRLIDQGIKTMFISTEKGGRYMDISKTLGIPSDKFLHEVVDGVQEVELKSGVVNLVDFFEPTDWVSVHKELKLLCQQLEEKKTIAIVFVHLKSIREKDGWRYEFYSNDLLERYASLTCKYLYEEVEDRSKAFFEWSKIREPREQYPIDKIRVTYNFGTKEITEV